MLCSYRVTLSILAIHNIHCLVFLVANVEEEPWIIVCFDSAGYTKL